MLEVCVIYLKLSVCFLFFFLFKIIFQYDNSIQISLKLTENLQLILVGFRLGSLHEPQKY